MFRKGLWPSSAVVLTSVVMAPSAGADPVSPTSNRQPHSIDVQVRDGLLTLDAPGAPLGAVVRAIGEKAKFETVIEGTVDRPVRRSFTAVPLITGLRYLLDGISHVMFYAPLEEGEKERRLLEVRLYDWEKAAAPPAAPAGADPEVLASLFSGERDARIRAIRELARADAPEAIVPLARLLKEDPDPEIRSHAARALGEIGAVAAVPALEAALKDLDEGVRMRAIRALAALASDEATRVLGGVLLDSPQRRSRLMAAWALEHRGGSLAQSYLKAVLEDSDELVQRRAKRALSAIAEPAKGGDSTEPRT